MSTAVATQAIAPPVPNPWAVISHEPMGAPPSAAASAEPWAVVSHAPMGPPSKPLTFGNTLLGEAELGGAGIANALPLAANYVDAALQHAGGRWGNDMEAAPFGYIKPGAAGESLAHSVGQMPIPGLRDAQGQQITPDVAIQRVAQGVQDLKQTMERHSPRLAQAVEHGAALAGDVANIIPGLDVLNGIRAGVEGGVAGLSAARQAAADAVENTPATTPAEIAPTKDALSAAASAAYKRASDAGVVTTPENTQALQARVGDALNGEIVDPQLHPKVSAVLARVAGTEGPQTLDQLDALRKVARGARAGATPDDSRLLGNVVDAIDDHLQSLTPADVTSSDPTGAVQSLQDARNLYSRYKKADTIDDLVDRAGTRAGQFTGSGFENAVRTEFRQLALNAKRMRTFAPEEQAAIKRVARGGPLANVARMAGKYAPTGVVSTALGGGIGGALGHGLLGAGEGATVGAVALPAIGTAARDLATRLTMRNVDRLSELLRRGPAGSAPLTRPVSEVLGDQFVAPAGMPFEPMAGAPGAPSPESMRVAHTLAGDLQLVPEGPGHGLPFEPSDIRLGDLQAATPAPLHGDIPFTSSEPLGTAMAGNLKLAQPAGAGGGIAFRPTQPNPRATTLAGDLSLEQPPQPPQRPLALPAPTRGPIAVDQGGRAGVSPADVAAHRQALGLDELGPGVRQPASGPNPEREAAAAQARGDGGLVQFAGNELGPTYQSAYDLKKQARAIAQKKFAGKTVTNAADGSEILMPPSGIKHGLSGSVSRAAALAMTKLDEVLEAGKPVGSEPDRLGRSDIKAAHFYDTPISVGGQPPTTIRSVVRELRSGRRYYDHFELEAGPPPGGAAPSGAVGLSGKLGGPATDSTTAPAAVPKSVPRGTSQAYTQRSEPVTPDRAAFLNRFQRLSENSPSNPAGRLFSKNVSVELQPEPTDEHTVHIEDLRALTTGQGHGAAALKKLTGLADRHGVRLTLDAHPLDKGGISKEKLQQFYQRAGFTPAADEWRPNLMVREPQQ